MKRVHLIAFVCLALWFCFAGGAQAQAPAVITYQGFLADKNSNPLSGSYSITFKIYKISTGGTEIWKETLGVTVTKGYLEAVLGSKQALTSVFDGSTLWLGITVGTDNEMVPRKRLTSVPYAMSSKVCQTIKGPLAKLDVLGTFSAKAYANQGEDTYSSWQSVSIGDKDTCDGKLSTAYTCSVSESKTCVDIKDSSKKRNVTCKATNRGMAVDNSGKVSIGSAGSPGSLEVNGTLKATSLSGNGSALTGVVPAGVITMYGATSPPSGWLVCNGQAVSRKTYSALFAAIGTTYGSGDGSTTFNVPNLKGRVPVGYDTGQTEFSTVGKTGGAKTHKLTVNEMPKHRHSLNRSSHSQAMGGYGDMFNGSGTTYTSYEGGGNAHNNLQPYLSLQFIVKY